MFTLPSMSYNLCVNPKNPSRSKKSIKLKRRKRLSHVPTDTTEVLPVTYRGRPEGPSSLFVLSVPLIITFLHGGRGSVKLHKV